MTTTIEIIDTMTDTASLFLSNHKRLPDATLQSHDENVSHKKRKITHPCFEDQPAPSLPDPHGPESPAQFLLDLVRAQYGICLKIKLATELTKFFPTATEEQVAAYTIEIVSAARNNDISELQRQRETGKTMSCFNNFGESLLHMACRRGFREMVEFLLEQPDVGVRVVDDCGRTPLHDMCWNPTPQLDICRSLMAREPSLFLVSDRRGFTPFDFARPEHWTTWKQFLLDNRGCLEKLAEPSIVSVFS
jgi:hypothetical protein